MPQNDHTTRDLAQIEADLERDRAALADSLGHLRSRLTMDSMLDEARSLVMGNLGPLTRGLDRTVRANPLAVAVIGAGVAWLALGRRGPPQQPPKEALAGTKFEAMTRWEDEGGPPAPLPEPDGTEWLAETERLHTRALSALASIAAAAKDRLVPADRTAEDRADVVAGFAADTRQSLRRGLEGLPASARDKIVAMREKAYLAHRVAVQRTGRMIEDDPLVAGCIALALGSGIAAALPQTALEDRLLGAERDRLVNQAKAVLADERARAADLLASMAGTLRHELRAAVV
ncbi:MAG: hypothetical protein WAT09_10680 [Paracoccaceae bacterium]